MTGGSIRCNLTEVGTRRSIDQQLVGDVRVVVRAGGRAFSAGEFEEHVREAVAMLEKHRVTLVVIAGGGSVRFEAAERAKAERTQLLTRKHAIVTPGADAFIETAMRWLGADLRVFPPHQFEDACDFLEIALPARPMVRVAVETMKKKLVVG